jgi:hypothetical protein
MGATGSGCTVARIPGGQGGLTGAFTDAAASMFSAVQSWISDSAGWFYVLAVAGFIVFVVAVALSGYGRIKLGPDHSEPDYSYASWFAMLFSAGMGIGLMFFGVAEPVMHYVPRQSATRDGGGRATGDEDHVLPLGRARLGHLCGGGTGPGLFRIPPWPAADHPFLALPADRGTHLRPDRAHGGHLRGAGHAFSAWPLRWDSGRSRSTPACTTCSMCQVP